MDEGTLSFIITFLDQHEWYYFMYVSLSCRSRKIEISSILYCLKTKNGKVKQDASMLTVCHTNIEKTE
jgi:hypothetical protein